MSTFMQSRGIHDLLHSAIDRGPHHIHATCGFCPGLFACADGLQSCTTVELRQDFLLTVSCFVVSAKARRLHDGNIWREYTTSTRGICKIRTTLTTTLTHFQLAPCLGHRSNFQLFGSLLSVLEDTAPTQFPRKTDVFHAPLPLPNNSFCPCVTLPEALAETSSQKGYQT